MATTIGSLDLNAFSDLYSDSTQYFWFEGDASATYGAGVHITLSPDTSFMSNPTGQNILMNTDGISIRNGLLPMMTLDNNSLDFNVVDTTSGTYVNVASFGDTTTIGAVDDEQAYMFLNYRSIQGIDKEGDTYFYVSDLRDANGEYSARDTFVGDGVTIVFALSNEVFSNLVVKVNDVEQTINVDYTYDSSLWKITFISPPTDGAIINVTYISRNQNSKAYTFGNRATGSVIGGMSVAEGRLTTASGYSSHAEGKSTIAAGSYSHAEGYYTTASGFSSHAEGGTLDIDGTITHNTASGYGSHAEGTGTTASKQSSHAEGTDTTASGHSSHAEGYQTTASGYNSHAEGYHTTSSGNHSHAEGGTLDIDGTITYNTASGYGSHAEGAGTTASKQSSHAEGTGTTASGHSSHAEGGTRNTDGTITYTTASGSASHAEGAGTTASGNVSHAEGAGTTASGYSSHAEGGETIASALSAHAEGNVTIASGQSAHAEGMRSVASGSESHAQNWDTKASSFAQTAIGKCNIEDATNTYAFIIGNGTDAARSNALTVDWDGNITVNNHSSSIGSWITDIPSAVSCGTAKYYKVASVTLTEGTWLIFTGANFPATNATGYRDIYTTTNNFTNGTTTAPSNYAFITRSVIPAGNYAQVLNASFPMKISSETTLNLVGHQNSGSTMSVTGRMYAVRIN